MKLVARLAIALPVASAPECSVEMLTPNSVNVKRFVESSTKIVGNVGASLSLPLIGNFLRFER